MVAPIPLIRDLLRYRDMSLAAERDLGLITALIAGGSIVMPILVPFAALGLIALAVRAPLRRRRAKQEASQDVSPVAPAVALPPPGATSRAGTVRPLYGCVVGSIIDGRPMLVEDVAIAADGPVGGTLFRSTRSAPFLLELDDDDPVVVTGIVRWVTTGMAEATRRPVRRGDPVLERLGLPDDLRVEADLVVDGIPPEGGARVEASGVIVEERVPQLATYRDGASVRVMRGEPGRPVLLARSARPRALPVI